MSNLKPIKLLPARERVASALRKAIMTNELKKGQEISLENIAAKLQVSATPVREAYQMLSQEGLIKLRHNKGAIVLGMNEKWVRDHFEVRAVLEGEAARKVADNPDTDLSAIENVVCESDKVFKAKRWSEYADLNQSFHMEIWTASGNEKLNTMLAGLWNGLSMGARVSEEEYAKISIEEHRDIFEAIKMHESAKAFALMHAHIIRSMNSMLTHLDEEIAAN